MTRRRRGMEPAFAYFAQAVVDTPPSCAGPRVLGSAFTPTVAKLHARAKQYFLNACFARRGVGKKATPWASVCSELAVDGVPPGDFAAFQAAAVESLRVHLNLPKVRPLASRARVRLANARPQAESALRQDAELSTALPADPPVHSALEVFTVDAADERHALHGQARASKPLLVFPCTHHASKCSAAYARASRWASGPLLACCDVW